MFRSALSFFLVSAAISAALGQEIEVESDIQVTAFSSARSPVFSVKAHDKIVVKVTGPDELDIQAAVYDTSSTLVAKETPPEPFDYVATQDGSYYVVGRNISPVDGTFSVVLRRGGEVAKVETPGGKPLAVVRVFYGTNRAPAASPKQRPYFLASLSSAKDYAMGFCDVRIPRNHKLGELEGAATLYLDYDPGTDIRIVGGLQPESDPDKFFKSIREKASQTKEPQILVFIHGFNVSFEDAARRTAQISYDLAFPGAAVLFSWPAPGSDSKLNPAAYKRAYAVDQQQADKSVPILQQFLRDLAARTGVKTIHLIAHSMGNRVLTKALEQLAKETPAPRFTNAILAAPDMDAAELKRISGSIYKTASRVTLYTSTKDQALRASEWTGNLPRAGNHIVYATNLETVDATEAKTELESFSHSYYADSPIVLGDLFHLLRGEPPGMRFDLDRICQNPECADGRMYWKFRPTKQ